MVLLLPPYPALGLKVPLHFILNNTHCDAGQLESPDSQSITPLLNSVTASHSGNSNPLHHGYLLLTAPVGFRVCCFLLQLDSLLVAFLFCLHFFGIRIIVNTGWYPQPGEAVVRQVKRLGNHLTIRKCSICLSVSVGQAELPYIPDLGRRER